MNYSQTIHINTIILITTSKQKLKKWMSMAHASFGVGGILGPLLTSVCEEYTYLVIGIMHFTLVLPYWMLESPSDL